MSDRRPQRNKSRRDNGKRPRVGAQPRGPRARDQRQVKHRGKGWE